MTSIRLPQALEDKLEKISQFENTSKSDIIKSALIKYFAEYNIEKTPYDLGKNLFGKYGSGQGNLSKDYKKKLKEKMNDKFSH